MVEEGGFLYDSDSYSDDLPYWCLDYGKPHLIIPYTLSENDMRFATPNGFSHGGEFSKCMYESNDDAFAVVILFTYFFWYFC